METRAGNGRSPSDAEPTFDDAHSQPVEDLARRLAVSLDLGLSASDVEERRARFGTNELASARPTSIVIRALRQLRDPMALLLIVAATISAVVLDEVVEAIAISVIVVLNVVIAVAQEGKAQRALEALRTFETPHARAVREGVVLQIDTADLVPGDVILLSEGDRVPGDCRLVAGDSLTADESSLTGESLPVAKDPASTLPVDTPVADRSNMLFSGTLVAHGSGRAVVTATGPRTTLGVIASTLTGERRPTPLQAELSQLTARLGVIAIAAASITLGISLLREDAFEEAFLAAVALAVAAVPEGLATVVTVALALGVLRMARRGAIVRRLPAVETLGATTVIATDKTGTLTRNELFVVDVWAPGGDENARTICVLCNDATLDPPSGDPLEIALLRWVGSEHTDKVRNGFEVIDRSPFDSVSKWMSVTVTRASVTTTLIKGAWEEVLDDSDLPEGVTRNEIEERATAMASRGLKVLGLSIHSETPPNSERSPTFFVGLIGLGDPIRPEAPGAVAAAAGAGVRLVMVTGDHAETAKAIGAEVGLTGDDAITGRELASEGVTASSKSVSIFARMTPDQKLELVDALQERGEVVAVTGDGVNDAPALHRADIGVAMGRGGTDAAKEAADLVITDDNLATIVSAIHEGRGIYDNIRKVVEYLVAANISEVLVVLATLIFFPEVGVPLLPLQLLWINLITDGLPAIALGVDPVADDLMQRAPRARDDTLVNRSRIGLLVIRGASLALASLVTLIVVHYAFDESWHHARAAMFVTLALSQLAYSFAVRGPSRSGHDLSASIGRLLANKWLLWGAASGLILQIAAVHWEPLVELLGTAPLSVKEWILVSACAVAPSIVMIWLQPVYGAHQRVRPTH